MTISASLPRQLKTMESRILGQFARQGRLIGSRLACVFFALLIANTGALSVAEGSDMHQVDGSRPQLFRQREIIYEGLVSYGNYRVFGGAENVKLYAAGVEYDRELWRHLFHMRIDGVMEVLPVLFLTQPRRTDIWGDTLSRRRTLVPGAGITPLGFRLLWRDGKKIEPYFEAKGSVLGFTEKALSRDATYENWSFDLTDGLKVRLRGRYELRLGLLNDLHFSNAFVVRSNPAVDVMNINLGLVCRLGNSRKNH